MLQDYGGEAATTKVMKIPNDCVGKVIGKGGCFIKQIKELSGAGVQIAKECQPSEPDQREVVMTGTPSQLAKCEEYVNMRTQGIMLPIDPHVAQMLMQPGGGGGYAQPFYGGGGGGGYGQQSFQQPPVRVHRAPRVVCVCLACGCCCWFVCVRGDTSSLVCFNLYGVCRSTLKGFVYVYLM